MKAIDVSFLERCTATLSNALELLQVSQAGSVSSDMYRSACIKEFEIIIEQSGKLLRKALKPYFASSQAVDRLTFKDVFRHAVLRSIITADECERWLQYRDSRNDTAHEYGADFAEKTLDLLPQLIGDAARLVAAIRQQNHNNELC
ncbi:MAG: nucleotidyltransferase substrate binding protein [Prevotellaceae bacterium]|jgi:nucleotidyltransferase substrate binding protein (TIGR01987 family)|nr:nucleotidyltransferase substrate binding protein [Prevotellaceae bacterium]